MAMAMAGAVGGPAAAAAPLAAGELPQVQQQEQQQGQPQEQPQDQQRLAVAGGESPPPAPSAAAEEEAASVSASEEAAAAAAAARPAAAMAAATTSAGSKELSRQQLLEYIRKQKKAMKRLQDQLDAAKAGSGAAGAGGAEGDQQQRQQQLQQQQQLEELLEEKDSTIWKLTTQVRELNEHRTQLEGKVDRLRGLLQRTHTVSQKNLEDSAQLKRLKEDTERELRQLREREEVERRELEHKLKVVAIASDFAEDYEMQLQRAAEAAVMDATQTVAQVRQQQLEEMDELRAARDTLDSKLQERERENAELRASVDDLEHKLQQMVRSSQGSRDTTASLEAELADLRRKDVQHVQDRQDLEEEIAALNEVQRSLMQRLRDALTSAHEAEERLRTEHEEMEKREKEQMERQQRLQQLQTAQQKQLQQQNRHQDLMLLQHQHRTTQQKKDAEMAAAASASAMATIDLTATNSAGAQSVSRQVVATLAQDLLAEIRGRDMADHAHNLVLHKQELMRVHMRLAKAVHHGEAYLAVIVQYLTPFASVDLRSAVYGGVGDADHGGDASTEGLLEMAATQLLAQESAMRDGLAKLSSESQELRFESPRVEIGAGKSFEAPFPVSKANALLSWSAAIEADSQRNPPKIPDAGEEQGGRLPLDQHPVALYIKFMGATPSAAAGDGAGVGADAGSSEQSRVPIMLRTEAVYDALTGVITLTGSQVIERAGLYALSFRNKDGWRPIALTYTVALSPPTDEREALLHARISSTSVARQQLEEAQLVSQLLTRRFLRWFSRWRTARLSVKRHSVHYAACCKRHAEAVKTMTAYANYTGFGLTLQRKYGLQLEDLLQGVDASSAPPQDAQAAATPEGEGVGTGETATESAMEGGGPDIEFNASNVKVAAGSDFHLDLPELAPGALLQWSFDVSPARGHVGFTVCARSTEGGFLEQLSPYRRVCSTTDAPSVEGSMRIPRVGAYVLVWDNTFSWVQAKQLRYKVGITHPAGVSRATVSMSEEVKAQDDTASPSLTSSSMSAQGRAGDGGVPAPEIEANMAHLRAQVEAAKEGQMTQQRLLEMAEQEVETLSADVVPLFENVVELSQVYATLSLHTKSSVNEEMVREEAASLSFRMDTAAADEGSSSANGGSVGIAPTILTASQPRAAPQTSDRLDAVGGPMV